MYVNIPYMEHLGTIRKDLMRESNPKQRFGKFWESSPSPTPKKAPVIFFRSVPVHVGVALWKRSQANGDRHEGRAALRAESGNGLPPTNVLIYIYIHYIYIYILFMVLCAYIYIYIHMVLYIHACFSRWTEYATIIYTIHASYILPRCEWCLVQVLAYCCPKRGRSAWCDGLGFTARMSQSDLFGKWSDLPSESYDLLDPKIYFGALFNIYIYYTHTYIYIYTYIENIDVWQMSRLSRRVWCSKMFPKITYLLVNYPRIVLVGGGQF